MKKEEYIVLGIAVVALLLAIYGVYTGSQVHKELENFNTNLDNFKKEILAETDNLNTEVSDLKNFGGISQKCEVDLKECPDKWPAFEERGFSKQIYSGNLKVVRPSRNEYPGAQFCCNILADGNHEEVCFAIWQKPDCVKILIYGDKYDESNWLT
ncbi:MAG: hypothetical protein ABIE22_04160 [archaeon]